MLRSRLSLFVLLVACAMTAPAIAQPTRANAAHEKLKSQADQAYRRGDYATTVRLTNTVISQNRSDAVAFYLRGSARIEIAMRRRDKKEMRGGIGDAREAIRLDAARNPMYYLPYLYGMTNLSIIEQKTEHAKVSIQFADELLTKAKLSTEMKAHVYYQRGNANMALGKLNDAVSNFQSAIRFNSKHLGAHMAAADALARSGKTTEAEKQFGAAIAAYPTNPLVYNNRGMFYQSQAKFDKAIADFTKSISLDRKYVFAYTNRGFAKLQQNKPAEAEADFSRSLTVNPNQPAVYSLRAASRVSQGKLAEALQDNQAALKLAPKNPSSHADFAFTMMFSGKFAEADKAFSQSLQLNPNQPHLAPWIFLSREMTGKKAEALAAFKDVLAKKPDQRQWYDSVVAFLAGKIDATALLAATDKKDDARKNAQNCEAHYFIGLREYKASGAAAAKPHFQKAVNTNQRQLSAYQAAQLALRKLKKAGQ